jgi:Protein of unknown function (DUF3108)
MRRVFFPVGIAALCFATIIAVGTNTALADPNLALTYSIEYGGIRIMELDARLDLAEGAQSDYSISLDGHTVGFLGNLKPVAFSATAEGTAGERGMQPAVYATTTHKRNKLKSLTITFQPNDAPITSFTPPDDKEDPGPPELLKDSIDPGSAVVGLIHTLATTSSCNDTIRIFDGKRRYDITFTDLPNERLKPSSHSMFSGRTHPCHATMVPRYGFKRGKGNPWDNSTVWFGQVLSDAPMLPVRIDTQIGLGPVRLNLIAAHWLDQRASR